MYKLEIQKFFDAGGTPEQLTETLGIHVKPHPEFPNLLHFSYDQLQSPKNHPIVKECRGLILDSAKSWQVIAFPFRRFGNCDEPWADVIEWTTARVQEKVDGSLIVMWRYNGGWHVSTKGSPDAGGNVGDWPLTFSELFWKIWASTGYDAYKSIDPGYTYMFELTSPYNRIVCSYKDNALTLIGVRQNFDAYEEEPVSEWAWMFRPVKEFPLTSVDAVMQAAEALDPINNEGFVVVDKDWHRVKIKSPSYVLLHHLKTGFGQRRIIRLIQMGESSEVLSYFPEYQSMFDDISGKLDAHIATIESDWERLKHITDSKAFALEAVKTQNPGALFALHREKATSVRHHILYSKRKDGAFTHTQEKIERMIGLNDRELTVGVNE